jgi:hypothetical protein
VSEAPGSSPHLPTVLSTLLAGYDWSASFRSRVTLLAIELEQQQPRDWAASFQPAWAWATEELSLTRNGVSPLTVEEIVLVRLRRWLAQGGPTP